MQYDMPAHYFPQVLCIFCAQKRGAQRTSGCLLVLFFSLFPEQPHELLAHTIQTLLSKQLLFSSWALLYCSLLQYLKCFTNIKVLIFMPFTWTCNNSTLLIIKCNSGKEVENIPICIPRWRHGSLGFSTTRLFLSAGAAQFQPSVSTAPVPF